MTSERPTGALVVGGDYQGLAIARSLGRKGIPVCVVDDEPSIARFSRYVRHTARARDLRDEAETVRTILDVGERLGLHGWIIFPTRDEVVTALSRARDTLSQLYRVPTPPWTVVRHAIDKRLTYDVAQRAGVDVPATWHPRSAEELSEVRPSRWPLVVKPAIKQRFIYETRVKGWVVHNRDDLRRRYREAISIVGTDEVIVQEMIPGNGDAQYAYCAFFKDGASIGRMVARRKRQFPMDLGRSSTYVETVDLPDLTEPSERLLRELGYYGLVELEYKRDEDGSYKLLDVNARTWGYHSLGRSAGVDFPLLLFRDQVGLPVDRVEARPGVRWVRMLTDAPSAVREIVNRNLTWREYLHSLRVADAEAVFSRDDVRPMCAEVALLPHLIRTRTSLRAR